MEDIGESQEYNGEKYLNIGVSSESISADEETRLRLKINLPVPTSFPIDAFNVGNGIRSKKCKIFNEGKGFATISIIDATFVVDSAHENYCPYNPENNADSE